MKLFTCRCGHEVYSNSKPQNIRWTDGHVCRFTLDKNELSDEEKTDIFNIHQDINDLQGAIELYPDLEWNEKQIDFFKSL